MAGTVPDGPTGGAGLAGGTPGGQPIYAPGQYTPPGAPSAPAPSPPAPIIPPSTIPGNGPQGGLPPGWTYDPTTNTVQSPSGHTQPNVAAPTATPQPAALPNPDMQWVDAFNSHMADARKAIDSQLMASTQQLGMRRDAAASVVAGLPKQFAAHYKTARGDAASMAKVMEGTVGGRQAIGSNANDHLAAAVLSGGNAAANSTVPMLQLGNEAAYSTGVATLDAAHTAATAGLDTAQSNFYASMATQAAGAADSAANARAASNDALANAKQLYDYEHAVIDPTTGRPEIDPTTGRIKLTPAAAAGAPTMNDLNNTANKSGFGDVAEAQHGTSIGTALVPAITKAVGTGANIAPLWKTWTPAQQGNYVNEVQKVLGPYATDAAVLQYLVNNDVIYGPAVGVKAKP